MKLQPHVSLYKLPPLSQIVSIVVTPEPGGDSYRVQRVGLQEIEQARISSKGETEGMPVMAADLPKQLLVWPVPNKEMALEVIYAPPLKRY